MLMSAKSSIGDCHARFGPRLISVRPDQKRLPEIVRPDNFRCLILSHVPFFGPTIDIIVNITSMVPR